MKSGHPLNIFVNPLLMWSRLAWQTGEMAAASSQVIGHRTRRLALAGPVPNARDQREFALMSQEKSAAALESVQAAGLPMLALGQQVAVFAFKQMFSTSMAMMSIATSRTAAESATRQSKLVSDTLTTSMAAASRLAKSTVKVARSALKPVHTRVSSNARRLGKPAGLDSPEIPRAVGMAVVAGFCSVASFFNRKIKRRL